jgi:hypothetical protein
VTDTTKETTRGTDAAGTKVSTREYQDKESISSASLKEYQPTAEKKEMTEKIIERGKTSQIRKKQNS